MTVNQRVRYPRFDPLRQEMKNMNQPRTLAIDIGGTGIKAALLDE